MMEEYHMPTGVESIVSARDTLAGAILFCDKIEP